jgi:hypothetical protein
VRPIVLNSGRSPRKRVAEKMGQEEGTAGQENIGIARPVKKIKKPKAQVGVLRGRPILQDVVNGEK